MRRPMLVTLFFSFVHAGTALNPHPRIWLTSQMISEMTTHPDWPAVRSQADAYLTQSIHKVTITTATNGNPVSFTTAEPVPWSGSTTISLGGATGLWAAVNTPDTAVGLSATKTGANTFTVPVDSSSFGPFTGQNLVSFLRTGCLTNYICYDYQGFGWLTPLETLSLAWKVTGNVAYANKGKELLNYINTLAPAQIAAPILIDSGYPTRAAATGVALAFDWLYDQLTDAEKLATAATCNLWFDLWKNSRLYQSTGAPTDNYWGGHILGFGALGHATFGDNSRAQEIIDYVRTEWNNSIPPAFAPPTPGAQPPYGAMSGGYPNESYNYGPNHLARLFQYLLILKTANNEDLFSSTTYAHLAAKNLLYNLKPNRWQSSTDGDFPGDYAGVMTGSLALFLSHALSSATEGAWMQFFWNNWGTPPPGSSFLLMQPAIERLLWYRSSRTATDYRLSQPIYYYSSEGRAYWRSGWTDTASELWTMFDFAGMYYAGHQGRVAGHIDIQRGNDYLIVNSQQWKGNDGVQGNPQLFSTTSQFASTLFADDGGAYMYTGPSYVGGQTYWSSWKDPRKDLTASHAYVSTANLADAYDRRPDQRTATPSLTHFYRTFVAMGDGTFVVFDRVRMTSSAYTKHLRFHMSGAAGSPLLLSGNVVKLVVGNSAIFISTLLPALPVINVVQNTGGTSYRAEISDSVPGTDLNALNVLYATTSTGTPPNTTLLTTLDNNFIGVQVADATPKVVVLAKSAGSATYSSTSFTTTFTGTASILVADLVAGTYDVIRNGTTILASQPVTTNGTLYFTSTSGAFSIAPQSIAGGPGETLTLTNNLLLTGGNTVDLVGTASNPCHLEGNGYSINATDNTWSGHLVMRDCTIRNLGSASNHGLDLIAQGSGYITIENTSWDASSSVNIKTYGAATVSFRSNVVQENSVFPVVKDLQFSRPFFNAEGNSATSKFFQRNRIYKGAVSLKSPNWLVGGDTSADGNVIIGLRAGIFADGAGSAVRYNYTHVLLPVDPVDWYWSQVTNLSLGAGSLAQDNVIRTGHWVTRLIFGELKNNVVLESNPHAHIQIGNGKIHHNIFASIFPGAGRYGDTGPTPGDVFIHQVYATDGFQFYNNTLDGRATAAVGVALDPGSFMPTMRNNVFYRFSTARAVVGPGLTEPITSPYPSRLGYTDYNLFNYDPAATTVDNYAVGVTGKTERVDPGFAYNDVPVGGVVNGQADPKLKGPLPIGFPFSDEDIKNGVRTVSEILNYYRYVYSPAAGSPLINAGDPADGAGTDIGAVEYDSITSVPPLVTTNKPPVVYAGPDFSVVSSTLTISLGGFATDDALPSGSVTTAWSKVTGPGTVTFGNLAKGFTTATFSQAGLYVLRLTASDGSLSASDDVAINIGGSVSPATCDLNMDGIINSTDVALATAMAVGTATPDPKADLNQDGKINAVDVQRIIQAATGGGCRVGP